MMNDDGHFVYGADISRTHEPVFDDEGQFMHWKRKPEPDPFLKLKPVEQPRKMEIFYGGLDVEELTKRIDQYLDMKHTNTWPPRQWSVADVESKEDAIDWFVDVCIKIGIVDVTVDDPRRVIP